MVTGVAFESARAGGKSAEYDAQRESLGCVLFRVRDGGRVVQELYTNGPGIAANLQGLRRGFRWLLLVGAEAPTSKRIFSGALLGTALAYALSLSRRHFIRVECRDTSRFGEEGVDEMR